jgi:diguanylate cyclase (GGDEF)-like protein/PAS domain S-box-containing protein
MTDLKVLIVEDAGIVALDIKQCLINLGYRIGGVFAVGTAAIEHIALERPDLVLMDINIKGPLDGIETAAQIQRLYDIPVIYLTAYTDQETVRRAKLTEPFGYVIKPFEERELNLTIEMAVYRHRMARQLKEHDKWLSTTLHSIGDAVIATDESCRIKLLNPVAEKLTGWTLDEARGRDLDEVFRIINETSREPVTNPARKVFESATIIGLANHTALISKDGVEIPIDDSAAPIKDDRGKVIGAVLVFRDVSARKDAEQVLLQSEARYRAVMEQSADGIFLVDTDTKQVLEANRSFCRILGYSQEEALNLNLYDFIADQPENIDRYHQNVIESNSPLYLERVYWKKNGAKVEVQVASDVITYASRRALCVVFHDISERKRVENQLTYLSMHDCLTGIYNRTFFEEKLNQYKTSRQHQVGIVMLDLDGLKLVNDTFGHQKGDQLLITAAKVVTKTINPEDMAFRIGGDEFAVLALNSNRETLESLCHRIQENVALYNQANVGVPLNISFGFACSENGENIEIVFKEADDNMYREKLYRSQSIRSNIVQAMMKMLEVKDFITQGHAIRLLDLVERMGATLKLTEPELLSLRLLAQFHDIGKVGTPDRVLFKASPLNPKELAEIKRHSEIGHRIANSIPDLTPVADQILKHHEWWDGSGYPLGLRGDAIPVSCRILAFADAYDAMTSDRPYRKALSTAAAIAEIRRCSGRQFDPQLTEIFVETILAKNQSSGA